MLIGLSTFTGDLYFRITGDRLTLEAIDAMWDPAQLDADIAGFFAPFVTLSALGTAVLVIGIITPPPHWRRPGMRMHDALPLIPCSLLMGLVYYVGGGAMHEARGMPTQFYPLSLFAMYSLSPSPAPVKSEVEVPLVGDPAVRHVVLIVDESIAGDFIDINVLRGTTPWLASRSQLIANFGLAVSASNCSHHSNAVLRLGANPATLGGSGPSILANPSIWKYAKFAAFETTYIDAQRNFKRHLNHMNDEERGLIDYHVAGPHGLDRKYRDQEVAARLAEILIRSSPQFVLVNKSGAHFPYASNYPKTAAHFLSTSEPDKPSTSREHLVNSYMNAIKWSVDDFFARLIERSDLSDTVIIYTSDHGQNLLDDGSPATHCRRFSQTLNEAIVPLFVVTANPQQYDRFSRAALENFNKGSHFEIFPTILTLFGYDPKIIRDRYHQSLLESIDEPLGFTTGDITGRFGRHPAWNSRDGLETYRR